MRVATILITLVFVGGAALTVAQTTHTAHGDEMDHALHGQVDTVGAVLTEPGQGSFAALSEVVRVLEADPNTNWAIVDLSGLRAHLVDMDRLITGAFVTETVLPNGVSAVATGNAETIATLQRIVPAHAAQLANDNRWTVEATQTDDGMELRVTSDDLAVIARIKGLGFFGLMASQDHHREHHLMMARGRNAHDH